MVAIFTGAGTGFDRGSGSILGSAGLLGSSTLGRGGEQLLFNAATGNFMVSQRDEYLVGLGLDASVARTYNSLGDLSDDNGDNWRQGYDKRVVNMTGTLNSTGSTVQRVSGDGSVITHSWDAAKSAYVATDGSGAYDTLTSSGGVWTWTDGDSQIKETYSAYGAYWRLTSQADSDGNAVSFAYTGDKLTQVTTADGSTLTYSWSGNNLTSVTTGYTDLATSTVKTLTRTSYTYDGQNRLSAVTVDLTPDNISDSQTYVTTYTYDGTSTRVASIAQSDGSLINITYDGSGRVATMVQTASSGVTRSSSIAYFAGYTEVTDPLGLVTRLDYDAAGQLTKITLPPAATGVAQQQIQFAYNASGDVTSVTDALGNITSYSNYDANGNAQTITDRLGNVVTRTFGAKNELLTETTTSSDAGLGAASHTVRFVYDSENHLRYRISAEGYVTEYRYTAAGDRSHAIDYPEQFYDVSALGPTDVPTKTQMDAWRDGIADQSSIIISQKYFDARGNVSQALTIGADAAGNPTSAESGRTDSFFVYDQTGNLRSRYTQGRNTETFVYDGLNRLTSAIDVNGATTSYVFNDANTTTTVTYATGLTQVSTYNKAGELISFAETATATTLGASVGTATYAYDKDGRLRWSQDATGRKSYFLYDQLGRKVADVSSQGDVVEYRYDAGNRLVASIVHGLRYTGSLTALDDPNAVINPATYLPASNASDLWSWNIYDKEGRLLQTIDGLGWTSIYEYDGAGRLIKSTTYANNVATSLVTGFKTTLPTAVTLPPADAARDAVTRTFYDKDGRLLGVLDGEGYLSKSVYDKAGQKVSETRFFNATSAALRASGTFNQLAASITPSSSNDRTLNYVYNGQGQLRYVVDSLGYVSQTDYDGAGQATTVIQYAAALAATSDYTFDNVKALIASGNLSASVGTRTSWTVYDSSGRAAYVIDAEGGVVANSYNAAGQLIKTTQFSIARATTSLPTKATMDSWVTANVSAANDRVTRFYYDGSGQLRYTVDAEGCVARADVDAEGRVTKSSSWANKLTVGDSTTIDTLHSLVTSSGGTVSETLTAYDALGRVDTVTNAEGGITRYTYGANRLVSDETIAWGTSDAATVHYVYDGAGRIIETHAGYGSPEVSIVKQSYDGLGNVLTITDPNNKVTTRTCDRLGQVLTETDPLSGIASYQYDAFGSAVKVTDKLGRSTFNYYDKRGLLIASRDAEDYVTESTYTAFGQVANVTRRYNKATGTAVVGTLPTVTAHAKDAVTAFEYDKRGLTTKATDAEGHYEQYTLNAFGNRTSVRNKLGGIVTNVYDRRGLLTAETLPMTAWKADGTSQATSVTNKFEYDARGNRTRMIEAFGLTEVRTTNYAYDKLGRLLTKTLDAVTTVAYNDFTSTTAVTVTTTASVVPTEAYVYDVAGRLKQVTDALGGRTVSFYDDLGRKTDEVGPLGTMTHWTYDAAGNMLTARVYGDAVAVPLASATAPPAPINASNYRETVYTYDSLNRLKTTSIANVLVGSWNGTTGVAPTTVTITTTIDYDANGNVIKTTDANGGLVFSYYDKLGRKTAQVDAENYITTWTYDGEGNVLSETRFATKYAGTPVAGGTAPTVAADAINDRVTSFTYDKTGHRLTETRAGVKIATVSTVNGAITESTVNSVITYAYNGLGQVLTKQEAAGDTVTYVYDSTGRLTKESRASYADYASASVTPTVEYLYNGLNNLSRTRQGGATAVAGDRITTYAYGANGRLASMTDPAGGTHNYDYDAAGNIVRDSYTRLKSDGTTSLNEGILYRRDLLGRVVNQTIATKVSATSWTRGDGQNMAYNVYGEVSQRGINGRWQESFTYDNAGRVTKNNSGDGVWRFFVYDANGNKTLTLESEGTDLASLTLSQALALAQPGGVAAGSAFVDGINVTIATYDKRGQLLSAIMPQRELSATGGKVTITSSQVYNAFGEVATQTDARGFTTDFTYSTMGRLIQKQLPTVNWTDTAGVVTSARPTANYYYDLSGRLVASRDANSNLTSRTLLAGSGYGEAEGLVTAEYHADGGIFSTFYDQFGDARILRNELYNGSNATQTDDVRTYDAMGRLITQVHRGALLTENFTYDLLGQRVTHWNSFFGSSNKETTDYDLQGRVVSARAFGGDITTNSYVWSASIATALGTTGGWTQTTTQLGKTKSETSDIFGNVTTETDTGSHSKTNTYDKAGRLTNVSGSNGTYTTTLAYSYFNTGFLSQTVDTAGTGLNTITSTFAYDANGNRTAEKYAGTVYKSVSDASWNSYVSSSLTLQDVTVTYDALGRVSLVTNKDAAGVVNLTMTQQYDLASNIRRTNTTYPDLVNGGSKTLDRWFSYDAMNRMVIANGASASGVRASTEDVDGAVTLTYDLAGNRKTSTRNYSDVVDLGDGGPYKTVHLSAVETYTYDANNQLTGVSIAGGDGGASYTSTTTRDALGRVTAYTEANQSFTLQSRYGITYNARGQVTYDETSQWKGGDTYLNKVTNTYDAATGMLTSTVSDNYKNGSDSNALDTSMTDGYAWYDTGKTLHTDYDRDTGSSSNSIYTSDYVYDGLGRLQRVKINDGINRTVHFANTADEQILLRDVNNSGANDPEDHHLFVSGQQVAEWTTDNNKNIDNFDYETSVLNHASTGSGSSKFYQGGASVMGGEFGTSAFTPLNPVTTGSGGNASRYTVRSGDTLQGIAASLWGDGALWYKLAEANGLSADAMLSAGQSLSVPVGVVKNGNSAATFNPYDTARATGDLSPTTNKPPKSKKCAMFGQLLIVVVAIAVTAVLTGPLSGAIGSFLAGGGTVTAGSAAAFGGAIAGGALAGAAGSIVSQGVGMAAGIQDGFSWKGVALSALAGGVSGGIGQLGKLGAQSANFVASAKGIEAGAKLTTFGKFAASLGGGGFVNGVVRGITTSVLTQGVSMATTLQHKFDWVGVAAAGLAGGVEGLVSENVGGRAGQLYEKDGATLLRAKPTLGHSLTVGMAGGIAEAATLSVAKGTSFGDNLLAALPNILGRTIGNSLVDAITTEDVVIETASERQRRDAYEEFLKSMQPASFSPAGTAAALPANVEIVGKALKFGNTLYTAAQIMERLHDIAEASQIDSAIKKFGLDRNNATQVLSAASYVWGTYHLPELESMAVGGVGDIGWSGSTNEAAAQSLMRITMVDPGIFVRALGGSSADMALVVDVARANAANAISQARPKGVEVELQTSSRAYRKAIAADLLSGRWQVHHLVPAEVWGRHAVLARLAQEQGWHQDAPANLIALPADEASQLTTANILPVHNGSHPRYNALADAEVTTLLAAHGGRVNAYQAKGIFDIVASHQRTALLTGMWNPRVR